MNRSHYEMSKACVFGGPGNGKWTEATCRIHKQVRMARLREESRQLSPGCARMLERARGAHVAVRCVSDHTRRGEIMHLLCERIQWSTLRKTVCTYEHERCVGRLKDTENQTVTIDITRGTQSSFVKICVGETPVLQRRVHTPELQLAGVKSLLEFWDDLSLEEK